MGLFNLLFPPRPASADDSALKAKERVKIIVARERGDARRNAFVPEMKREILAVITKYVPIEEDKLQVLLQSHEDVAVLEINIELPADDEPAPAGRERQRVRQAGPFAN